MHQSGYNQIMRTTVTLDDDVSAMLARIRAARGLSFKEALNEALRLGLSQLAAPGEPRTRYTIPASDLGRCLIGNVANVAEALAAAEGDGYR